LSLFEVCGWLGRGIGGGVFEEGGVCVRWCGVWYGRSGEPLRSSAADAAGHAAMVVEQR